MIDFYLSRMGIKKTLRMIAPPTWGTVYIYVGLRSFRVLCMILFILTEVYDDVNPLVGVLMIRLSDPNKDHNPYMI